MRIIKLALLSLILINGCRTPTELITEVNKVPESVDPAMTFINPIITGADPWITKENGFYYICLVGADNSITVGKSNSLIKPGKRVRVWKAPAGVWNSTNIWAPELHRIGNKWYIYYAAGKSGPPYNFQRSGVLESLTDDPQGQYIDRGVLNTGDDPRR